MSSAMRYRFRTLYQYRDLLKELVSRDLKLKYRRSFLGYLWSILNPLLVMIVMTIVFSAMFKRNIKNFPVYLLCGRMCYDFLQTSTNAAMRSVTGNQALLKKTYIPKYIFTLAKVTSGMVDFALSFGALFIVVFATRCPVRWTVVMIPLVVAQLYIFCLGVGFILGELHVFFRDIQYIYRAFLVAWLYLTPIFSPIERLPLSLQMFIKFFNPMYYYITQLRAMVLYGVVPEARLFWGGWIIAFVMLVIGLLAFQKNKDRFILYI